MTPLEAKRARALVTAIDEEPNGPNLAERVRLRQEEILAGRVSPPSPPKLTRDEIARLVAYHGLTRVAAVAKVHPKTPQLWASGKSNPLGVREKWLRAKLQIPTVEGLAPMTIDEIRARVESLGGPTRTAKRLGITLGAISAWLQGYASPCPRNRLALRRATGTIVWHGEDTSPMTRSELMSIIRIVGMSDICVTVGCSHQTSRNWLEGTTAPSPKYRAKLRRAYRTKCGSPLVDPQKS